MEASLTEAVPKQQASEASADNQDLAFVGERIARDGFFGVNVFEIRSELAFECHVVSSTGSGFFELPVLRLFFGVEHCPRGLFWQRDQCFIFEHCVARAGDLLAGFRGPSGENL